jgi:uncharacterized membrane protein
MDDNKKAKIYGIIALIFVFIQYLIFITVIKEGIKADTIGTIIVALYFISMILMFIFIILAIYTYFRYFMYKRKKSAPVKHAIKVLYERYAKGEISKEELERKKKDLEE